MKIVVPSDFDITLTVLNADGTAFDLDTADDIVVAIYQRNDRPVQKFYFSKDTVIKVTPASGIMKVQVNRENSKQLSTGKLYAEINLITTDADMEGGKRHTKIPSIELKDDDGKSIEIEKSVL